MFSFMFVCKSECDVVDEKFRDFVFEIIAKKLKSVLERFDTKFSVRNPRLKKKKRYFDVANINNTTLVTLSVNPKEYTEIFHSQNINKKTKA